MSWSTDLALFLSPYAKGKILPVGAKIKYSEFEGDAAIEGKIIGYALQAPNKDIGSPVVCYIVNKPDSVIDIVWLGWPHKEVV